MSRLARAWPAVVIAAAIVVCIAAAARLTAARREADAAQRTAETVLAQAKQILQARAAAPGDLRPSSSQAVYTSVAECLRELAISTSALAAVEEVAQRSTPQEGIAEQVVRIRLERLHPADLGRFLARWRHDHPEWTVTQIHLTASRTTRQDEHDGRYDAQLVCAARRFDPNAPADSQSPR